MIKANKIVHPMYLVKYLNALLNTTNSIRSKASLTYGEKGKWLILQNKKYKKLEIEVQEDVWSYGTVDQRNDFLSHLIKAAPEQALKVLEESWASESSREKLRPSANCTT